MLKRIIPIILLIFISPVVNAQALSTAQLIKLYGLLIDATTKPRNQFIDAAIYSMNNRLQSIDSHWSAIASKGELKYKDDDLYFTWTYHTPETDIPRLEADVKLENNELRPVMSYLIPYSKYFWSDEKELSAVAEVLYHKKNSYNGFDTRYKLKNLIITFSTYPPMPGGPKLNGQAITVYSITITYTHEEN